MTVATEPEIQRLAVSPTSNAVPNTQQSDVILAAPGAGLRYRIYGISCAQVPNNAANVMRVNFSDTGSFTASLCNGSHSPGVSYNGNIPSQGIPLAANAPLNCLEACTILSIQYRCSVQYVFETV